MATKIEVAIDFIARKGSARSYDIGEAANITANQVCSTLYPFVRGGVLVSCRVEQPGKASCNEYRLATGVTAQNWRDFKVGMFSETFVPKAPPKRKRITPPAHTPADQPQVSDKNSGSTSRCPPTFPSSERAVTQEKPHRKAAQPAPGAGGHVISAHFCYWSDGRVSVINNGKTIELNPKDAKRLADFLMNCMISNEVNA